MILRKTIFGRTTLNALGKNFIMSLALRVGTFNFVFYSKQLGAAYAQLHCL